VVSIIQKHTLIVSRQLLPIMEAPLVAAGKGKGKLRSAKLPHALKVQTVPFCIHLINRLMEIEVSSVILAASVPNCAVVFATVQFQQTI
jgi:hypothetical protein